MKRVSLCRTKGPVAVCYMYTYGIFMNLFPTKVSGSDI